MSDKKCSYCKNNLGKGAKYAFKNGGKPTIYKCKRRYCKLFRWLGIFKVKSEQK